MLVTENMRKRNFMIFAPHSLPGRFPSARENAFRISAAGARCIATERSARSISAESCGDARLMGRPFRVAADCQKTVCRHCAMFMALPQAFRQEVLSPVTPLFLTGRHGFATRRIAFSSQPASIRPRECLSRFGGGRAAKGRLFKEVVRDVVLQFFSQRAGIFETRAVFALQCVL